MLMSAEMCRDIQASNNARKLGEQQDCLIVNTLAVNQTCTHRHNCDTVYVYVW